MGEDQFVHIGSGLTVYLDAPVQGPVRWLDSPQAVMEFVKGDDVADTIVLARGGTTTFLTPALTAGVKGMMTLQGAPESHLGILSREYGIPCIMGVSFERGVRSARGEVIPADGAQVRLDVSTVPEGRVYIEPGAATVDDYDGPVPSEMPAEQLAQIQLLLTKFGGVIPHGLDGDAQIRKSLATSVLTLDDESLHRELSLQEVNDLSKYAGWNTWDCLAARATEGESGLIPRQEYEAVAFVQSWQRYGEFFRLITDEIGADGVIELGRTCRRELATKMNPLHHWAVSFSPSFGRGIALGLGIAAPEERWRDIADAYQFARRLYRGTWDGLGDDMYAVTRGYKLPLLGDEWLERFQADKTSFEDPEQRKLFQRFSASTELMGFLQHFDNRAGLADSGPYPTPDGGFVIVRDHFLAESIYQWRDAGGEELPYAITQAMFFKPDEPLDVRVLDIGTLFTEPANYLKYLTGAAVYARDAWNTPADQIRLLSDDDMRDIQARCDRASGRLYPHIAAMSKREKIMAGMKVYYADFILPYARAAGVWDRMVDEFDFFELDPLASQAYYKLVTEGVAAQLVPQLFLTGEEYPPIPESAESNEAEVLRAVYEGFREVNEPLKTLCTKWQGTDTDDRAPMVPEFAALIERAMPAISASADAAPRFAAYRERLQSALGNALAGDHQYVTGVRCDSIHMVWMEIHHDYIETLGIDRVAEGSF
ncbi:MAG: PEP-utilizing enzyme [Solirubrobacteraceae bacterium]